MYNLENKNTVVVYSYYSPEELTGIGKYNGELIDYLKLKGYNVISVSNVPFYPYWKMYSGFKNLLYSAQNKTFKDIRTWVYIPRDPNSIKKIWSELTFFFTSMLAFLIHYKSISKAKFIYVVNPPFFLGTIPLLFSKLHKIPLNLHVQDLQVDAARELSLIPKWICNLFEVFESALLNQADFVSTISIGMKDKLNKKIKRKNITILPNWSNLDLIKPLQNSNWLHNHLNIPKSKKLIVYSGNIGAKQGLEIVLHAAKELQILSNFHFVILGEGLNKKKLISEAESLYLTNCTFGSLVPNSNMNDMLNSSYIQLIIQRSEGADLFLPSKLTNILAAGCASIITADQDTSLYNLMYPSNSSLVIQPNSTIHLIDAIKALMEPKKHDLIAENARKWAEENLSIDKCLAPLITNIELNLHPKF